MRDASLVVVSSSNDSWDTLSGSDDNYYEYDYSSAGSHEEEAVRFVHYCSCHCFSFSKIKFQVYRECFEIYGKGFCHLMMNCNLSFKKLGLLQALLLNELRRPEL
ncbi:hypothetical protein WN944_024100 [Citrus x changshan-huyou]|uniref:Uncharacterized protein n=1 Tax=Citrus x changshan-huyou TaxID=2935761 RepID=A0AAP0QBP9_9ROSI